MVYLHEESLSPDPTYGRDLPIVDNEGQILVHPASVVSMRSLTDRGQQWADWLDMFCPCGPVELVGDSEHRRELLLDFGTELHGWLELTVRAGGVVNVMVVCGKHRRGPGPRAWL